ncbi:MAG: Iron-sulfur cluster assembly ATPase protein SufC [uncultured bacterium]|nr:MAG: Iron-sulfur cluster assembly ATPase protein SufC [uncultured bacterium]
MDEKLEIKNLQVKLAQKPQMEILRGVNLAVKKGEIHFILGKNGSGKTTLAQTIMGHPDFMVKKGKVLLSGKNILPNSPDTRAKKGLFLSWQVPLEIEGVSLEKFLWCAYQAQRKKPIYDVLGFHRYLLKIIKSLKLPASFLERSVNEGLSGGEKKKSEILQLLVLQPKFAILDEFDSGLDLDALKNITRLLLKVKRETGMGILLITHYPNILRFLKCDQVHLLDNGRIMKTGGQELAKQIAKHGFQKLPSK